MPMQVLLCPPAYFDVVDEKNPYMSRKSSIDRAKAQQQWDALRSALEDAGCQVETIDPAPGHEDMVFAANQVFLGFHAGIGKFVVPSRMVHSFTPARGSTLCGLVPPARFQNHRSQSR
jgi:N-dimethylarginine dimethylaminohydrolase